MNKLKVGAVSYLNTKPFLYGLEKSVDELQIDLIQDYPSKIAIDLLNNKIDIALVPVAIIPLLKEHYIISEYCIGAVDKVASVSLFSDVEIDKIETVILDYQSKTSVALTQILFKYFWKKEVQFINANENYIEEIKGSTAAVVIGDRALEIRNNFKYNFDLAQSWIEFTKLPFVFATWISNKKLDEDFTTKFNKALGLGFENLNEVIEKNKVDFYNLEEYYTKNIYYAFDEKMKQGLSKYLSLLNEL